MDINDNFYKTYHYHMYFSKSLEKWIFVLCPKTFDFSNYCPFCAATSKLYLGTKTDKAVGYQIKRKTKHCINAYIVKDPRDQDKIEEERSEGKVLIYEFPSKIESKIKSEMNDVEYGCGQYVFDPGEDGFDFVLKVGATKPIQDEGPNKGKVFPEYGDSKFSSKSSPIADSDDIIEQIMEQRHDLDKYLKSMMKDPEDLVELLKKEMLWDLIEEEATFRMGLKKLTPVEEQKMEGEFTPDEKPEPKEENPESKEEKQENKDDEDFLKELEGLDDDIPF
jgi:hypothetical protein